ncbi:MAG: hypothetical protein EpisKO_27770 [Epibacterium sp.]
MTEFIPTEKLRDWRHALPFWLSLALVPLVWAGAYLGSWWVLMTPLATWYLFAVLDGVLGLELENADPQTAEADLKWYVRLTSVWVPIHVLCLFGLIAYVSDATHLSRLEKIGVFFGMGVISGTIGINYSHELMHQRSRLERWLADILLAMVLYSHFRSEHLLVHHRYVGTPRDPVTARYNEGFTAFIRACSGNAGALRLEPRQIGWRANPCPGHTAAIPSGAIGRFSSGCLHWPFP